MALTKTSLQRQGSDDVGEIQNFLQTNLGDDRAFANSILNQFKYISQHQQVSILELAAHLEHLQSILLAYDLVEAPAKSTMLRYF